MAHLKHGDVVCFGCAVRLVAQYTKPKYANCLFQTCIGPHQLKGNIHPESCGEH